MGGLLNTLQISGKQAILEIFSEIPPSLTTNTLRLFTGASWRVRIRMGVPWDGKPIP